MSHRPHFISVSKIIDFLDAAPGAEDPSTLRELRARAEVARLLPYDHERAQALLVDVLRQFTAMPAWRAVGQGDWRVGSPPADAGLGTVILGVIHPPASPDHPRELDGQDYPDPDPLEPAPRWLRIATWAVPLALVSGCSTLYFLTR
jgi:hypothetical protein